MRLTEAELKARSAFDLLTQRGEVLDRHVRKLQSDLALSNREDMRDLLVALDQARGELVALGPKLKTAWREIEASTPAVRLPPAPPTIQIMRPAPIKIDPPRRKMHVDVDRVLRQGRWIDDNSRKARFSTDATLDPVAPMKAIGSDREYIVTFALDGSKVMVKREYYERQHRHWLAARRVG